MAGADLPVARSSRLNVTQPTIPNCAVDRLHMVFAPPEDALRMHQSGWNQAQGLAFYDRCDANWSESKYAVADCPPGHVELAESAFRSHRLKITSCMKDTSSVPQSKSKFEQAMVAPERTFETPDQVVENEQLSLPEKRKILEAWRDNEIQLLRASGEGMAGGERPHLPLLEKALARLEGNKPGAPA